MTGKRVEVWGADMRTLLADLAKARTRAYRLTFMVDEGGLKVKINDETWSPSLGKEVE